MLPDGFEPENNAVCNQGKECSKEYVPRCQAGDIPDLCSVFSSYFERLRPVVRPKHHSCYRQKGDEHIEVFPKIEEEVVFFYQLQLYLVRFYLFFFNEALELVLILA